MGEYHNNLTLEEAIKIYESIPAERLHGIKGIGFDLQDGDEDYSGEYGLMSGDRIDSRRTEGGSRNTGYLTGICTVLQRNGTGNPILQEEACNVAV